MKMRSYNYFLRSSQALLKEDKQDELVSALFAASREWSVELHFNKGLAGAPPEAIAAAKNTAMNPAVIDSFALAIIAGGAQKLPGVPGHEPDLKEARKDARYIAKSMQALRRVVPSAGAYVSKSSFFELNWQIAFWGENYARLKAVKTKYDPDAWFSVHQGVGTEA